MSVRSLTRITMRRIASDQDKVTHLFVFSATLRDEQKAFLAEMGVEFQDGVYEYTAPGYYQGDDVNQVRKALEGALVTDSTTWGP